jgi:hypothetical protein
MGAWHPTLFAAINVACLRTPPIAIRLLSLPLTLFRSLPLPLPLTRTLPLPRTLSSSPAFWPL